MNRPSRTLALAPADGPSLRSGHPGPGRRRRLPAFVAPHPVMGGAVRGIRDARTHGPAAEKDRRRVKAAPARYTLRRRERDET
ncbi:hypothetical protein GCM10010250_61380 [Streptomyces althioticus]|nr:hypothetical protein GCM10010250_61380 [Streptomyces althioticus]